MRLSSLLLPLLALPAACAALEVSTGFLIGPRYDPRAFYVRGTPQEEWRKTNTGPGFRKTAQGKLFGVPLKSGSSLNEIRKPWVSMISIPLQGVEGNSFDDQGRIRPERRKEVDLLLQAANRANLIVELVLFDPRHDQEFFSPDHILEAARNVTDWLIDRNYRNVIISFTSDWTARGWAFDNFIPFHLERLASTVRERFQARHTDFALPIAMSVHVRLTAKSPLIEAADLLLLGGEAVSIDTSKIERPALVLEEGACLQAISRASGCVVGSQDSARLTPLIFTKPPREESVAQ